MKRDMKINNKNKIDTKLCHRIVETFFCSVKKILIKSVSASDSTCASVFQCDAGSQRKKESCTGKSTVCVCRDAVTRCDISPEAAPMHSVDNPARFS